SWVPEVCGPNANCSNSNGSYSCTCLNGYNVTNSNQSINVNECTETSGVCGPNANCINSNGSYNCTCQNGYTVTNSNQPISITNPCTDVDECSWVPEVCGPNANCINSNGSYSCTCQNGYTVTNSNQPISINNPCTGMLVINRSTHLHALTELQTTATELYTLTELQLQNYSYTTTHTDRTTATPTHTDRTTATHLHTLTELHKLSNDSIEITTATSHLQRRNFSQSFNENVNSTQIDIPATNRSTFITAIVFTALRNVLPVRTSTMSLNDSSKAGVIINGDVAAVLVDNYINNISLTFDIQNPNGTLGNPQCVFWNFNLLDGIGGWDSTGCEVKTDVNITDQVTCECNHTTSFSILMSPFLVDNIILDYITYIGVGISIICLILNDTSYMRHVSIVNIALSLLIADVCFLIGAGIVEKGELAPVGPCSTATFFMHFFYLALFFWMLLSALLLLYRTVVVFAGMSKTKMMIIAFTVGYGAPLLIAVLTVAATAGQQGYIVERSACWLNWDKTKAFLAFVIPALTIVVINLVVLIVVLWKMLRRGVGATTQPDEKHAIVVIARCVAILTPLFGLTWGFGIGTMVSGLLGIHIIFLLLWSSKCCILFTNYNNCCMLLFQNVKCVSRWQCVYVSVCVCLL
uniref:Adhesion G protein-coupled receptor F7 n=1 Tax=Astyanax mexicanus TaxID=7994 RepID=A0A3B1JAR9_ASTMX